MLALGLFVLAVAGCQNQDEIRRYRLPRVETVPVRMLAAMVSHGDSDWFFKVLGPAPAVEEHKDRFDRFFQSVRFTGKPEAPLTWALPDSWREEPKGPAQEQIAGMERYATFRLPTKDHNLELSVVLIKQQGKAADVLDNVNRWRVKFLGLPAIDDEQLAKVTKTLKIGDSVATTIDMTGPGLRAGRVNPMKAHVDAPAPPPQAEPEPLEYQVPDGWKKVKAKAFSKATFRTGDDDRAAEVTVSSVGGGLLLNVNRWRGQQLGLPEVSEEELRKDLRTLDVAGAKAAYIELIGPDKGGQRKAILGVLADHGGTPWVFKMIGPADVVAGQKASFEAFVRSARFGKEVP